MDITKIADILDDAMYKEIKLAITTKERGFIIGIPHNVDEFDTDPDRLGYFIMIDLHFGDTVFLDEITAIHGYNDEVKRSIPQSDLLRVSGE